MSESHVNTPFMFSDTPCALTEEIGYVLYSALGSFFIPLALIIFVYIKIWQNMRNRIRKRAEASGLNVLKNTKESDEESRTGYSSKGTTSNAKRKINSMIAFSRKAGKREHSLGDTNQNELSANISFNNMETIEQETAEI